MKLQIFSFLTLAVGYASAQQCGDTLGATVLADPAPTGTSFLVVIDDDMAGPLDVCTFPGLGVALPPSGFSGAMNPGAKLTLEVKDVDPPETDRTVSLNGNQVGTLTPQSNTEGGPDCWFTYEYDVSMVPLQPVNVVTVSNSPIGGADFCVIVDWVSLSIPDPTGGGGDPHFTTWSKDHFDFQGECDLVLIDNSSFMEGTGLTVHGRTKLHGTWSAFASAAVKIGDDVLEVHGSDPAIINGKQHIIQDIKYGTEYAYHTSVGGYSLTVQHLGPHSRRHIIHFGNGEKMFINNFKEFVDFEVDSPRSTEFAGSVGLLGSYNTGLNLARDGKTVIEDADEFGQEWQVIDTDTQLFSVVEGPQYPDKCNMPVKLNSIQRHLRAMSKKVSEDDAKAACAKAPASRMENCIADVFGSDNLDMAGIYVH